MRHRENNQHSHADRGHDLYETPPEATRALMEAEWLPQRIWEPTCGRGAIVRELRAGGHDVVATDLIDYGAEGCEGGHDFLKATHAPPGVEAIVANFPYKHVNECVARALHLCPRVYALCRLGFLAGTKRTPILDGGLLARVLVFKNRLPMMHRDSWSGPKATSQTEFAWFIWNRAHFGPPLIQRISWKSDNSYNSEDAA